MPGELQINGVDAECDCAVEGERWILKQIYALFLEEDRE